MKNKKRISRMALAAFILRNLPFPPGREVWVIVDDEIMRAAIGEMKINGIGGILSLYYTVSPLDWSAGFSWFPASNVFDTKREALTELARRNQKLKA